MSSPFPSLPSPVAAPVPVPQRPFWSLLTAGAPVRLLLALCACGVLWGTIAWAV